MSASGWDASRVYYHNTLGVAPTTGNASENSNNSGADSDAAVQRKCLAFLENFRIDAQFPYRYVFFNYF